MFSPALPRLSSTILYATHAMIEIAEAEGHVVNAATIVDRQRMPGDFLDQLLGRLRRAGLLRSVRGPRGGYALARPSADITLADIVTATEPSFESIGWGELGDVIETAVDEGGCAVVEAWRSVGSAMRGAMEHTTLAALVRRKHELERQQAVHS